MSDEEFESFYLELVGSLGVARDDLIVEIGVGDLGTTITVTSVVGVAGTETMTALLPIAFPEVQFNEVPLFERRVFRPADPNTMSRHIAVFADPTSAIVIDAPSEEALARAAAAFP